MKLRNLLIPVATLLSFASGGTVSAHDKEKAGSSMPHASITFENGSSTLADSDKTLLRKMIQDARAKGKFDKVAVAAWSDKALPDVGETLSDADQNLARDRANAIQDYLKTNLDVTSVETFNMAESANWLARNFRTKDAELKSLFGKAGATPPLTQDEFKCVKRDGGPSMGVAVVERGSDKTGYSAPTTAPMNP